MSASNVETLVVGETATARLGQSSIHGRVVGTPANGSNFQLVAILPDGAHLGSYVDCWLTDGWTFEPDPVAAEPMHDQTTHMTACGCAIGHDHTLDEYFTQHNLAVPDGR